MHFISAFDVLSRKRIVQEGMGNLVAYFANFSSNYTELHGHIHTYT